uniref:Retrovirus-related Pol polyprotein from transposon TNT 1-94 n=1 Tax=Tanacetum cinerariifolium TaxID=118510 RepID=A0A699JG98_TANCI|nr:hypothetical protein [Tanacetum cinerariifolium]
MLTYKRSNHLEVVRYADSNYAGSVDSGKSTFGYVFQLAEGAISWKSAKQSIIAASTMKAEFVACYEATIHALWLWNFISGLGVVDIISVKHMDIKFLNVKEKIQKQRVYLKHISTDLMIVDPLTKGLPPKAFTQHVPRPDISFAIGMLSIYQSNPDIHHWKAAKKVLSYLQGTKDYMLTDKRSNYLELVRYADFDYVGCVDSGKSTFGYVFQLVEGAISWKRAKQSIIDASTMEAEFVPCYEATIHALWLRNFISGLGVVDCRC